MTIAANIISINIVSEQGYIATIGRIVEIHVNINDSNLPRCSVVLLGWETQAKYDAGLAPIIQRTYVLDGDQFPFAALLDPAKSIIESLIPSLEAAYQAKITQQEISNNAQ